MKKILVLLFGLFIAGSVCGCVSNALECDKNDFPVCTKDGKNLRVCLPYSGGNEGEEALVKCPNGCIKDKEASTADLERGKCGCGAGYIEDEYKGCVKIKK